MKNPVKSWAGIDQVDCRQETETFQATWSYESLITKIKALHYFGAQLLRISKKKCSLLYLRSGPLLGHPFRVQKRSTERSRNFAWIYL